MRIIRMTRPRDTLPKDVLTNEWSGDVPSGKCSYREARCDLFRDVLNGNISKVDAWLKFCVTYSGIFPMRMFPKWVHN